MAGKWHLGTVTGNCPVSAVLSARSRWPILVPTIGNSAPTSRLYDKANWYADGKEYQLPEDFYSSRFLVDKTIEFIDSNIDDGMPFFAYLPFQAVHIPVQAPQEFIDRNMGVYDSGWDALREQRYAQATELGIVPAGIDMSRMSTTGDWDALDASQRRYEAKRMAVYAAMVEAMDFHIGRLVAYLKASGNTTIPFLSLPRIMALRPVARPIHRVLRRAR